ncbi:hypothetical protein XFLAVUS301_53300 [Xanthobacter flavus]|nr:hypothetical protein XFLAVUS301_53300 [Xanthobacter flavus]
MDWWRNGATLDMDFANNRYMVSLTAPVTYTSLTQFIAAISGTFARSSSGTYFDASGTLRNAPANTPRLDYDPSTTEPKGILIEEARTNVVRNSGMIGAGSGVSATLPNNWFLDVGSVPFNYSIYGTGVEQGIPFLDIRFWGTSSGGTFALNYEQASTGTGSIWTGTHFVRVIGGSLNNLTLQTGLYFYIPSETAVLSVAAFIASDSALAVQRSSVTATAPSGTTAVRPRLRFSAASGAFDVTLRIGGPQLEQGAFPTSYIPTSGSTVTRQADVFTLPTSTGWYNGNAGTLAVEAITPASYYNGLGGVSRWLGFASIDDGTVSNTVHLFFSDSSNSQQVMASEAFASGVSYYSSYYSTSQGMPSQYPNGYPTDTYPSSSLTKGAVTYSAGSTRSAYNGLSFAAGGGFTLPTATMLRVGARRGGSGILNSSVRRVWYMPTRQPDESLPDYTR